MSTLCVRSSAIGRYFAVCPSTHAFNVCHSGSFCELPVLAAAVIEIAARFFGERVNEQPALRAAGHGHALDRFEVLARLLVVPGRAPGGSGCSRNGVPDP